MGSTEKPLNLERFFRENIPLAGAMGIRVERDDESGLVLSAPKRPNVNDKDTAFAGSIAALATLAGASYTLALLARHSQRADVVIAKSEHEFLRPGTGDICAVCEAPQETARRRFLAELMNAKKARWRLEVLVLSENLQISRFSGDYVALSKAPEFCG